jgi:hypothetical protein
MSKSVGALRQQRYRERRRNERDAVTPSPLPSPSPADALKALLSDLCDALENIDPTVLVTSCDEIEILGLRGDAELASAWLGAVATLAGAAMRRAGR